MVNMILKDKGLVLNLVVILLLLISFPVLWLYNQRLNYRSFLTLNTRFSISANQFPSEDLSSIKAVREGLVAAGISSDLLVEVKTLEGFGVIGRILETPYGNIEIYEYSSPEDAQKDFEKVMNEYRVSTLKNLLIVNAAGSEEIDAVLGELSE